MLLVCKHPLNAQSPIDSNFSGNTISFKLFKNSKAPLPEKLLSIGDCAFRGCLQLKKMVLPSTLKIIVGNPFVSCLLDLKVLSDFYILTEDFLLSNDRKRLIAYLGNKSVLVIPNDVEYIGEHAFFNFV